MTYNTKPLDNYYKYDTNDVFWKIMGEGYDNMYSHILEFDKKPEKLAIYNIESSNIARVSVPNLTKNEDTYSYYMQNKYSSCYAVYVTDTVSDDSVEITEIPVQLNEFINKMCLNEELVINKTVMTHLNELKEKYQLIGTYLAYEYYSYYISLTISLDESIPPPRRLPGLMATPSFQTDPVVSSSGF
jgi:hypothetical protein